MLAPNPPMLVLVDWMMPKLDGIGFCERVKKEIAVPPYIILLTTFSGTTQVIKALDAGADEFLSKPFNPAELHSRLRAGERILASEYSKQGHLDWHINENNLHQRVMNNFYEQLGRSIENLSTIKLSNKIQQQLVMNELQNLVDLQQKISELLQNREFSKESSNVYIKK
ncbi:MAG: response regulator transcription factor [Legionellales bacterium]|nr:response regulator transcription factor [Legionellales bacterium]